MKRDEGGELRLPEELENGSFDDVAAVLADGSITRARAIKLAGAALLAGSGMMALFQSPAEAGKRRKKRRRRKKRVTATPNPVNFGSEENPVPAGTVSTQPVTITNNGTEPVYLQPQLGNGFSLVLDPSVDPSAPITLLPGDNEVQVAFTPLQEGVYDGDLTITATPDANSSTVKVIDLTGFGGAV